jgi:hypothetical protein
MLRGDSVRPLAAAVIGISVTLLAATYTAHASHVAAQGGWPPPLDLSQSGGSTSRGPDLVMGQEGDLHVIWMEPEGVTFTVYHAGSDDQGSNWTYSVPLTPAGKGRYEAAMDMYQPGVIHVVWREQPGDDEVWYGQLVGGSWVETGTVTQTNVINRLIYSPDIVATSGFVHAVWSEMVYGPLGSSQLDVFYSRSESGDSWSPATTTVETDRFSVGCRIAADPEGNLHVVWEENTEPPQIYYISGTVGTEETVWSMPITVSGGLPVTATTPAVVVGSDHTVHVVFGLDVENQKDVQDVYYASFPVTDTDGISATLIPHSRVRISHLLPTYASPAVTLVGTDEVHVAWNGMIGDDYADRIYYVVSKDGGASWSDPVPVSPRNSESDGFPSLAADERFVHVVWEERVSGTDHDINYARRFPVRLSLPLGLKAF